MKDRLKRCIRECTTKDRCDFYDDLVIKKIFDAFETEQHDQEIWLNVFIKIIGRIKAEKQCTQDHNNENGKKVFLPIDRKKCMIVFFIPKQERRYLIYDFMIVNR